MWDALFAGNAAVFTVPAILGSLFFLMRLGLMALGGFGHADVGDVDVDADVGLDVDAVPDVDASGVSDVHPDSTEAFKLLSVQTIAAFIMGFGWAGLGAYRGFEWNLSMSLITAAAGGALLMWLLSLLLKAVYDLQSSGNVSIRQAAGREGDVYVTVPAGGEGRGQVRLVINGRQRIYNAVTGAESIPPSTRVRVTRVNNDNTLTVIRA